MTDVAAATVVEQPAAPAADPDASFEARIAATLEQLGGEPAEDAEAPEAEQSATKLTEAAKTEPAPAEKDEPDPKDERREALARIQAMERENYRKSARVIEREKTAEEREKKITEREGRVAALEKIWDDPGALLEALETKVGSDKLTQWIIQQADPAKKAELAAKRVTSSVDEKLQKFEEENRRLREEIAREKREAAERQEFERAANSLVSRVEQVASEAPLVARFIARRKQAAITMADQIARSFVDEDGKPVPFNTDDVIIRMQKVLAADAEIFVDPQQPGSSTATSREQSISAAAKATTISNRAAAERSTLVTEDESDIPLDERARRLERRLKAVK